MHAALQAPKHAFVRTRIPRLTTGLAQGSKWNRCFSRSLQRHSPRELLRERFASLIVEAKGSRALQELLEQREEEKQEEQAPAGEGGPGQAFPSSREESFT